MVVRMYRINLNVTCQTVLTTVIYVIFCAYDVAYL